MKRHKKRMPFVVRFARMTLDHLRPGDWTNLKEDLMDFLVWFSVQEAEITPEKVAAIRKEVVQVLYDIVGTPRQVGTDSTPVSREAVRVFKRLPARKARILKIGDGLVFQYDVETVQSVAFDCSTPGDLRLGITANLRDSFLFALGATLSKEGVAFLRQCPTCTQPFYAEHARQRFCSPRCATKDRVRRFRGQEEKTGSAVKGSRFLDSRGRKSQYVPGSTQKNADPRSGRKEK